MSTDAQILPVIVLFSYKMVVKMKFYVKKFGTLQKST